MPPVSEIPTVIPPVDLNQRPFDPRDFTGRGMEGGRGRWSGGRHRPRSRVDEIYQATTNLPGFEPAMVLSQPTPEYPAALASVGIEGRVEVQFVIDTTGKVEPSSFQVVKSTQVGFEPAARTAIMGSVFRPAQTQQCSRSPAHPAGNQIRGSPLRGASADGGPRQSGE